MSAVALVRRRRRAASCHGLKRLSASSRARLAAASSPRPPPRLRLPQEHRAEWTSRLCLRGPRISGRRGRETRRHPRPGERRADRATKPKPRRRTCAMPPLELPTRTTPHARFRSRSATANRSSTHRPPFRPIQTSTTSSRGAGRRQRGPHHLSTEGAKYALHLVPSDILNEKAKCVGQRRGGHLPVCSTRSIPSRRRA